MVELIWLIIVIVMVVKAVKKQGGKDTRGRQSTPNQQARPSVPNQQARPSTPNQQARPSVPNQQARPSVPNQQARPSVPNQQARPSVPNQQARPSVPNQQELKARLQQRYGQQQGTKTYTAQTNAYGKSSTRSQTNDIFDRATANVRENTAGKVEQQRNIDAGRSTVAMEGRPQAEAYISVDINNLGDTSVFVNTYSLAAAMDADKSSELMRQVNDLMITGYQADISFERDFLAEGMELLGRYT